MRQTAASSPAHRARRLRAAMPVQGGASSLLRLSQSGGLQLPSGALLGDWVERAAAVLRPFDTMIAVADDAPAALVTTLQPSPAWRGLR